VKVKELIDELMVDRDWRSTRQELLDDKAGPVGIDD